MTADMSDGKINSKCIVGFHAVLFVHILHLYFFKQRSKKKAQPPVNNICPNRPFL